MEKCLLHVTNLEGGFNDGTRIINDYVYRNRGSWFT